MFTYQKERQNKTFGGYTGILNIICRSDVYTLLVVIQVYKRRHFNVYKVYIIFIFVGTFPPRVNKN